MKNIIALISFLFNSLKKNKVFGVYSINVVFQLMFNRKIIKYKYKNYFLFINNDSIPSVTYHIINSTPKIEKTASMVNECNVAFDIGANNGLFTFFLKTKFSESTVFVFEPSEILQLVIKKNLSSFRNVFLEKKAVSDIDGELTFYINPLSEQTNSIDKESVIKGNVRSLNREIKEVKVSSITLDSYVSEKNILSIDTLKVDIQGAEYKLLMGAQAAMKKVKASFFEISFLDKDVFLTTDLLRKYFSHNKIINDVKMGADIMFHN